MPGRRIGHRRASVGALAGDGTACQAWAATAGWSPDRQGRHGAEGRTLGLEVSAVALYALADLVSEVKTVGAGRIGRRRRRVPLSGRPIYRARRAARRAALPNKPAVFFLVLRALAAPARRYRVRFEAPGPGRLVA